jgi:hypothetical protein
MTNSGLMLVGDCRVWRVIANFPKPFCITQPPALAAFDPNVRRRLAKR